jgi:GAF domain-containing protein
MINAPTCDQENERLEAVHRMAILDTKPEERFDKIVKESVEKLKVPISMISIIDKDREWYKSCVGLDQKQGDRRIAFCGHALLASDVFIIEDTLKDKRFWDNPMVTGFPFIRFYAGVALYDYKSGQPVAVFCIKDNKPRKFDVDELAIFMDLAHRAEEEVNNRI